MVSVSISGSGGSGRLFFGGFLANSACRIDGGSSIREITVIGCSGKRISAEERACPCSIHALTHLARFLLIFLLCLFVVAICNFLSNMFSLGSGSFRESGVKKILPNHNNGLYISKEVFSFHTGAGRKSLLGVAGSLCGVFKCGFLCRATGDVS